jgi:hypothetical protein
MKNLTAETQSALRNAKIVFAILCVLCISAVKYYIKNYDNNEIFLNLHANDTSK